MMAVRSGDSAIGSAEALGRSRSRFQRFRLAIARRRVRHQIVEEMMCDVGDFVDRAIEGVLIRVRRFRETAQLPNELKRRCANLVIRRGRRKIMQGLNVSAHKESLTADAVVSK